MRSLKFFAAIVPWMGMLILFGLWCAQKNDVMRSVANLPVDTLRLDSFTRYEGGLGGSWRDCVLLSGSFAFRGVGQEGEFDSGWVKGDKGLILKVFPQLDSSAECTSKALMDFMSGDSFYLLIVPGRAVSILNQSRNGLLILEESAVSGAAG